MEVKVVQAKVSSDVRLEGPINDRGLQHLKHQPGGFWTPRLTSLRGLTYRHLDWCRSWYGD